MKALGRRIAATVTRGAVRCSAWLGVAVEFGNRDENIFASITLVVVCGVGLILLLLWWFRIGGM